MADDLQNQTPRSKYLGTWVAAQLCLNSKWLIAGINSIRGGHPVAPPGADDAIFALIGGAITGFLVKVWKELEADAVKGTANLAKKAPAATARLLRRLWDRVWTSLECSWPGYTRRYYREVREIFGLFNDKGLGLINANRLDLEKVYVELLASADVNLNKPNLGLISQAQGKRASIWHYIRNLREGFGLGVIGAPGSGKTTLLQHVLLTYAARKQYRQRLRSKIPFFIELRKVPDILTENSTISLADALKQLLSNDRRYFYVTETLPTAWINRKLLRGRCILLLDGLDEIADVQSREKVSAWLNNAISSHYYKRNVFIVSARPLGYRAAPIDRSSILEVQPFTFEDTKRFINQWYYANEVIARGNRDSKYIRHAARNDAELLLERLRTSRSIADLTSNPLLLTMVCMVHRYHGALPGSRGQLYAEISQVLLERWRQRRGIEDKHSGPQKIEVLRRVAAWMMTAHTKEVSEADVVLVSKGPLSKIGVPAGYKAALDFFQNLQADSGLFLERESGVWSFAHLSFQEYLCADCWSANSESIPENWDDLVGSSWWHEAILLYASKASDASRVVAAALQNKSTASLTLAFALYREKINIDPSLRLALDDTVTQALFSKDVDTFRASAEAWLGQQEANNYVRLDANQELSGWISNAEFQLFLLNQNEHDYNYFPIHWSTPWFDGEPKAPIRGISATAAVAYCSWLDKNFPGTEHYFPSFEDLRQADPFLSSGLACWARGEPQQLLLALPQPDQRYSPVLEFEYDVLDGKKRSEHGPLAYTFACLLLLAMLGAAGLTFTSDHAVWGCVFILGSFALPFTGLWFVTFCKRKYQSAGDWFNRLISDIRTAISGSKGRDVLEAAHAFEDSVKRELLTANSTFWRRVSDALLGLLSEESKSVNLLDQAKEVLRDLHAAQGRSKLFDVRVALRRSLDGLLENQQFARVFKKSQLHEMQVFAGCLNRRESGNEQAFEGLRIVRSAH
ncbi:MAG: NACHT domain-containing protein [Chthoniobacterales bacterium]